MASEKREVLILFSGVPVPVDVVTGVDNRFENILDILLRDFASGIVCFDEFVSLLVEGEVV